MLTWLATLLYLATAAACAVAARGPAARGGPRNPMAWSVIACAFVVGALVRATGLEHAGQDALRGWLASEGAYDARRTLQAALASAILIACFGAQWAALLWRQRLRPHLGGPALAAALATGALAALHAVRLVSFHAIDAVLYAGRVHLNWLLDGGLAGLVAVCAVAASRKPADRSRP